MDTRIVDETEMASDLDARIRASLCASFAKDASIFAHTRAWHGSSPAFSVLMEDQGEVIAHLGVVDRSIDIGHVRCRAAGVQNVCVLPTYRGRGLTSALLPVAMAEADKRNYDLGLLFCDPAITGVYARSGWRLADRPVVRQEDGEDKPLPTGNIAMWLPLKLRDLPPGAINLRGNDW
jgi:predicted N-acetyltransferase YhbS